jgi:Tpt phosphate/phosphoenolpyruvate translocator
MATMMFKTCVPGMLRPTPVLPLGARRVQTLAKPAVPFVQSTSQCLPRLARTPVRNPVIVKAAEGEAVELDPMEKNIAAVFGPKLAPVVVTVSFITMWYALNIAFNLLNKSLYKYFPFPYTVSVVHVVVGAAYCILVYAVGLKKWSFGRPCTKAEFSTIIGPAAMHAIGHIAANVSFAAVAISLTHTVKTLEPAFNVALGQMLMGQVTPLPVILSLIPIIVGVGLASAGELSFNWTGFISAMLSNLTFGFRAVWGKKAITKDLDSTSLYAYTTLISVFVCLPFALLIEGGGLMEGAQAAIAKVGANRFYLDLAGVGMLYHLYNQFAFNTLQRVSPVSHGVCNVVKRVAIIFSSVIFFNQTLTSQALVGTVIALLGTWLYTEMASRYKTAKPAEPPVEPPAEPKAV